MDGEKDVDKGGDGLDLRAVLCMGDKVSLAGLVFGVPLEDVELDLALVNGSLATRE